MLQPRSEAPLHSLAAVAAVVVGVAAMMLALPLAARLGLRLGLAVSELCLVAPGLLAAWAARGSATAPLALRALPGRAVALSAAAGATLWLASLGLFELQYAVWSPPEGYLEAFRRLHDALKPAGPLDALASLAAIALAPAVCEETLFRGLVLPSLRRPLGAVLASFASAALFGLIHLDAVGGRLSLYRVPFAFLVGLGLAAVRLVSGSLLPSLVSHATLNAITFAAAPLTDDPAAGMPAPRPSLGAALFVAGLLLTLLPLRRLGDIEGPAAPV